MDAHTNVSMDETQIQSGALQDEALAHSMERTNPMKKKTPVFVIGAAVAVLLGLATGYVGASFGKTTVLPLQTATGTDSSGAAVSAMPDIKVGQTSLKRLHLRDRKSTRLNSSHQIISY